MPVVGSRRRGGRCIDAQWNLSREQMVLLSTCSTASALPGTPQTPSTTASSSATSPSRAGGPSSDASGWLRMARDGALPPSNPEYAALADALTKGGLTQQSLLLLRHMRAQGFVFDEVVVSHGKR